MKSSRVPASTISFDRLFQSLTTLIKKDCVHVKPHKYHAVASFGSRKEQGQFDQPCDIAINAKTGNIVVADVSNKRVQLFSLDGIYLREYGQKELETKNLDYPMSVAFKRSGDLTICDSGDISVLSH